MNIMDYFYNLSARLKGIDDRPRFPSVYKKKSAKVSKAKLYILI